MPEITGHVVHVGELQKMASPWKLIIFFRDLKAERIILTICKHFVKSVILVKAIKIVLT